MTNTDLTAAKRFLEGMSGGSVPTPVLCAVSGGLDSMCLLHLLSTWGRERNMTVTAAHFNHRLRGQAADADEALVRQWCEKNGVPFVCTSGDVRAHAAERGLTVEEAARELRYAFLEEQKRRLDCTFILTAHHADDNAETMLLNLLRGTGARGLAGIPETRDAIARPFLRVTREELAGYAAENQIPHVEDETNLDPDAAARNHIRLRVMPLLKELNPAAAENMTRAAEQLRQDDATLSRMAEELLRKTCRMDGKALRIAAAPCLAAERAVANRAIHGAISRMAEHRKDLTARHVEAVWGLLAAAEGKTLSLPYGLTARREAEDVVLCIAETVPQDADISLGETISFGRWRVTLSETGNGRKLYLPEGAHISVTTWRREDRITLPESRGARSLKRLCAERGISPAERDVLPVLRVDGVCAAVPGVGVDQAFVPRQETAVTIIFHKETEERIR